MGKDPGIGRFQNADRPISDPKSSQLRALHFVVAGERYDTVCDLPVPLMLTVAGQVAARAA